MTSDAWLRPTWGEFEISDRISRAELEAAVAYLTMRGMPVKLGYPPVDGVQKALAQVAPSVGDRQPVEAPDLTPLSVTEGELQDYAVTFEDLYYAAWNYEPYQEYGLTPLKNRARTPLNRLQKVAFKTEVVDLKAADENGEGAVSYAKLKKVLADPVERAVLRSEMNIGPKSVEFLDHVVVTMGARIEAQVASSSEG